MSKIFLYIVSFALPLYAQVLPQSGFKVSDAVQYTEVANNGQTAQDSTGLQDDGNVITQVTKTDTLSLGTNTQRKALLDVAIADAGTTSTPDAIAYKHTTSGTAGTNFGVGIRTTLEANDGSYTDAGRYQVRWTSASSKNSHILFSTTSSGTLGGKFRLSHLGYLLLSGTVTSDASARLELVGDTDVKQLFVRGNATQTSDLATFEQSDGTDVVNIANSGQITTASDVVFSAGTLNASTVMSGSDSWSGTAQADTVAVSGAADTDRYMITLTGTAAPNGNDIARVEATATGFIVRRLASGTSGLTYTWFRYKP